MDDNNTVLSTLENIKNININVVNKETVGNLIDKLSYNVSQLKSSDDTKDDDLNEIKLILENIKNEFSKEK